MLPKGRNMRTAMWISLGLLWVLVIGLCFLLLGTLRSLGLANWRLAQLEAATPSRVGRNGLKPGKKAPDFTLPNILGDEVSLTNFSGRTVVLVFVQAGCGPCLDVLPELVRFTRKNPKLQVLVVNQAAPDEAQAYARLLEDRIPMLIQKQWSVYKKYEVFATPFAFLIDESGVIAAKGIISRKEHLDYLFSSVNTRPAQEAPILSGGNARALRRTVASNFSVSSLPTEVKDV